MDSTSCGYDVSAGFPRKSSRFRSKRTRAYLSGLERGQRNPTAVTLDKIARAIGVSIVELFQTAPTISPPDRSRSGTKR